MGVRMYADDTRDVLRLYTRNGKIIDFNLSQHPITTFLDDMMLVKSGEFTASYPLDDLVKYTYIQDSSEDVLPTGDNISVGYEEGNIVISGLQEGTPVEIYTINGWLIDKFVADGRNTIGVSMKGRQPGLYIVKVGCITVKTLIP